MRRVIIIAVTRKIVIIFFIINRCLLSFLLKAVPGRKTRQGRNSPALPAGISIQYS
jgi:hypothetical protein